MDDAERIAGLEAEVARLEAERDAFASAALIGLAGLIGTPAVGYVKDGGPSLLASDMRRMRGWVEALEAEVARLARERDGLVRSLEAENARAELWRLQSLDRERQCRATERERDAYRKAKSENDERFSLERDEAREEAERLRAELDAWKAAVARHASRKVRQKYVSDPSWVADGDLGAYMTRGEAELAYRRANGLDEAAVLAALDAPGDGGGERG